MIYEKTLPERNLRQIFGLRGEDEGFDDQKGADSVQPESGNTPLGLCKIYKRWFTNTESATRV